jgi:hypothetical protein
MPSFDATWGAEVAVRSGGRHGAGLYLGEARDGVAFAGSPAGRYMR